MPASRTETRSGYGYDPNCPLASLADLQAANDVVQGSSLGVRTPMMRHAQEILGIKSLKSCDLSLKLENMQTTGAFKVRGLINQLKFIPPEVKNEGKEVVTITSGNYGKAFSIAMQSIGLKARVLTPDTAPKVREKIMKGYGAKVERMPTGKLQSTADHYVETQGMYYLHPFDDYNLICGNGSAGFEILEEVPNPDVVVICCGGGGLLSGVSAVLRHLGHTECRIYGVEPENACCMYQSIQAGKPVADPSVRSIAAGLAAPFAGPNAFRHVKAFVDDILLLSEDEIKAAMSHLYNAGLVVEPAGAAAFGALMAGKVPDVDGKRVVAFITGGNVSPEELCSIVVPR